MLDPVHIMPEKYENAAFNSSTVRRLPSTLIRRVNRAFWKRSPNRRNLKTSSLRFRVDEKRFENADFRKRWRQVNQMISLTEFSSNTNSKMTVDYFDFTFLKRCVDGKHLSRFQSETSVVRFLRRTVDQQFVSCSSHTVAPALLHRTSTCPHYVAGGATSQKINLIWLNAQD